MNLSKLKEEIEKRLQGTKMHVTEVIRRCGRIEVKYAKGRSKNALVFQLMMYIDRNDPAGSIAGIIMMEEA